MKTSSFAEIVTDFFRFFIFPKIRKASKAEDEDLKEGNEIGFSEYNEAIKVNGSSVPSEACEEDNLFLHLLG